MTFHDFSRTEKNNFNILFFLIVKNMNVHTLQKSKLEELENRSRLNLIKFGLNKARGIKLTVFCCCAVSVYLEK